MQSSTLVLSGRFVVRSLLPAAAIATVTASSWGSLTYSIDWEGPTVGALDSAFGVPITEADLLTTHFIPAGPPPVMYMSGGFGPPGPGLGLPVHGAAIGHPGGVPGGIEVDALSFGRDEAVHAAGGPRLGTWVFSVDEFATGLAPMPPLPPNVTTEGAAGTREAAADLYAYSPPGAMPPGPLPPFAAPPGDRLVADGEGTIPGPGVPLGLREPTLPLIGPVVTGDNLDAIDVDHPAPPGGTWPVFYSLDGALPDLAEGFPGSGSALANGGFSGADVLITPFPGAAPALFIPGPMLGLDLLGFGTDDLDALVLNDNGDGVYTPPFAMHSWVGGATDMVFFSVRRGSAVIGLPDANFGVPIEEGDILHPPFVPGGLPGIYIAAEDLGLCTVRTCGPGPFGPLGDELDGLDTAADCTDDGNPDVLEIAMGLVKDCNGNLVPDECEGYCLEDANADCTVDVDDLVAVIIDWGCVGLCTGDITGDGKTDVDDLVAVILAWGGC